MSEVYTKQHTVPKCYLRNFSFGKEKNPHVYVYDKIASKQRVAAIKDICCVPNFYTLSEFSDAGMPLSEKERKQYYETNYLKKQVEDSYGPCLKDTISKLNEQKTLSVKEKMDLSHYIAIQYLRLPIIKPLCSHIQNGLFSDIDKAKALISEYEKEKPHVMRYYYDDAQAHFNNGYGNIGTINNLTCLYGLARWEILYSPNNICTSDYPILTVPSKFDIQNGEVVLNKDLENHVFPISKDYLLTIEINPDASYYRCNSCIVNEVPEMDVLRYNVFQFLFCQRYVIKHAPFNEDELKYINATHNKNIKVYE